MSPADLHLEPAAQHNGVAPAGGRFEAPVSIDPASPQPKILVVDDTPANIRVMTAVLEPMGYRVLGAGSGPEALELVRRERPDLILLDLMMPGMDGYEVCRQLRADPATSFLPVVMVTASNERDRV